MSMSVDHAVQTAIRGRLVASSAVTDLVPASSIRDSNSLPAVDPCIIIGDGQSVDEGRIDRGVTRVFSDLHIWKKETGLVGVKDIAGAIREAIHDSRLAVTGYSCGDAYVSGVRYLRDPDGVSAHAVLTIETVVAG